MRDWQPIATAPEEEVVLVHDGGYFGKAMFTEGRWLDIECGSPTAWFDPPPTEWMPLPAPPQVQS